MKKHLSLICVLLTLVLVLAGCSGGGSGTSENSVDGSSAGDSNAAPAADGSTVSIPQVTLNFAMEPYPDHTDGKIALDHGWFEDVGITIEWSMVDADKISSVLVAGTADFASGAPSLLIPSMQNGNFETFALSNLFYGYSIMVDPDAGYKTYEDFVAEGLSPEEAVVETMAQMKGKIFTYPSEAAIKPFIDLCFEKGGLDLNTDVVSEVQQDSNNVALMMAGRADFQCGGVPSKATLAAAGYVPLISSADLVQTAEASADSIELRSILHNGWTTTQDWAADNHDTVLRLASVRFRLNQFIHDNPEEAAAIHMPFLNQQSGTEFTVEEGVALYATTLPMYTLEMQDEWFNDASSPMYWEYEVGSVIKLYEGNGVFAEGEFTPSDIVSADKIYAELIELKGKAEANLAQLGDATGDAAALRDEAQKHYDIFNFLDAERFSAQALELV